MAKILKFGNTPKYKLTCRNCKTVAEYDKWELNEYEDFDDCECVEFRCPVCGKFTSIYKYDLNKCKTQTNNTNNDNQNNDNQNNHVQIENKKNHVALICLFNIILFILITLFYL